MVYDRPMRLIPLTSLLALACAVAGCSKPAAAAKDESSSTKPQTVLVFTRTAGFRHDSIPVALDTLRRVGAADGISIEHSEDATSFNAANLLRMKAVVFANTTGDVLDAEQQRALQDYIEGGGGFLGIHSAADTEYDWPWYGTLVGSWFDSHPPGLQTAEVSFPPSTVTQGRQSLRVTDELYNYRSQPPGTVIATVSEKDYQGGTMGDNHPIAWCQQIKQGRSWYTGLGHDAAVYNLQPFREHLRDGLRYVTGQSLTC